MPIINKNLKTIAKKGETKRRGKADPESESESEFEEEISTEEEEEDSDSDYVPPKKVKKYPIRSRPRNQRLLRNKKRMKRKWIASLTKN
jgi:hypothetical protein